MLSQYEGVGSGHETEKKTVHMQINSKLYWNLYMWQSHVKIEGYSVAYFDCITVFEVLYRWTSIKGGAHTCFVDLMNLQSTYKLSS